MKKYHYLVLFLVGYAVACPLAVRALYVEREKNAEAFVETEAFIEEGMEPMEDAEDVSAGGWTVSENVAVSDNAVVSDNDAVSGNMAVSGNDAVSGNMGVSENGAVSDNMTVSENRAASDDIAVSENHAAPKNNTASDIAAALNNASASENHAISDNVSVSENHAASDNAAVSDNMTVSDNGAVSENAVASETEFFKDALFIGDSRTVGLAEYAILGSADVFATEGMNVFRLYSSKNSIKNQKGKLADVLAGKQYRKIYLMLGINELGFNRESALKRYEEEVLKIKLLQPDAKIILEANLHVTTERSGWDKTFNNAALDKMNDAIRAIAEKHGFSYIDINEFFDDETGGLNSAYSRDGIHLMGKHYQQWVDWIKKTGE